MDQGTASCRRDARVRQRRRGCTIPRGAPGGEQAMTEAEMPIEMVKSTLGGALKNGPLRVPAFQREYSWKKDRVTKLFDDFANAMRKNQTSYFMGTVLLTPGRPPCIIDGQQRLATTTIFL